MEELDAFEAQFDRRQHVREIEDRLTIELKTEELAIRPGPGETQAEMNTTARERYERASIRLHLIRDGLLRLLSPTERVLQDDTQRTWEAYRDHQANFAAAQFEGGTIQPLVRATELERLTIERAAILETDLEFKRSTSVPTMRRLRS
jgi:uncharacterized protein YecT (DUF1311 family)